jgi:hypothetical protein
MANLNGIINGMNNLSYNIESNSKAVYELNKRVSAIEGNTTNVTNNTVVAETLKETAPTVDQETIDEIRKSIVQLENNIKDKIMKERMLVENTIMAKTEELVKRIVSEKVASETQLIATELKLYINELYDQGSDTLSVAQSEIKSITQKKKGGKKTFDI